MGNGHAETTDAADIRRRACRRRRDGVDQFGRKIPISPI